MKPMKVLSPTSLLLVTATTTSACLPGSVGEWHADVVVVATTGSPPATIADTWRVDVAVLSSPFAGASDLASRPPSTRCGIRVDIAGLGVFELDGGVSCTDDGFEALLQGDALLEQEEPSLDLVQVSATPQTMILQLEGDQAGWTRLYDGPAER